MFELKRLSPEGIERALEKVERYRLLNEPWEAESISRDVLEVDPGNEEARIQLLLSLTDQFGQEGGPGVEDAETVLEALDGEYERAYYAGIICERKGTTYLKRGALGSGPVVYDWLRKAMAHYERAQELSAPRNEDALVRWNTCARIIMGHDHVREAPGDRSVTFLE